MHSLKLDIICWFSRVDSICCPIPNQFSRGCPKAAQIGQHPKGQQTLLFLLPCSYYFSISLLSTYDQSEISSLTQLFLRQAFRENLERLVWSWSWERVLCAVHKQGRQRVPLLISGIRITWSLDVRLDPDEKTWSGGRLPSPHEPLAWSAPLLGGTNGGMVSCRRQGSQPVTAGGRWTCGARCGLFILGSELSRPGGRGSGRRCRQPQ